MATASTQLEPRIARALDQLGTPASTNSIQATTAWIALVSTWNDKIDLTAARSDDELVDLMLADAAVLSTRIQPSSRVADIGTGAGAPGLPLALLRPDLHLTLVEPLQKRVSFLRTAVGKLLTPPEMRSRIEIVRSRGEELCARAARFDVAISRATLAPADWLELGSRLASEVWVLLAREEPPSLSGWTAIEDFRYQWPLTGAERRVVRFVQQQT